MPTPIVLPDLGAAGTALSLWYADLGDHVLAGERIVEILCDHATFEIISPATGVLSEKRAFPREPVVVGQILGLIEEGA